MTGANACPPLGPLPAASPAGESPSPCTALRGSPRSSAREKVVAVRAWAKAMTRTPKEMKGFLEVFHWYSIYIPQYALLAAALMASLRGKYERAPEGGKCKVCTDRSSIEWTEIMEQIFAKIKEALCEKCALYIPNDTGQYAIHVGASDFGIGGVLEQLLRDGSWAA